MISRRRIHAELSNPSSRVRSTALAVAILALLVASTVQPAFAARHKAGPVFIRGTVTALGRSGFTLDSPSKGVLKVSASSLTTYSYKGKDVRSSFVLIGSHIGVHGYQTGNDLKAIAVTVYVHEGTPKEQTARGTVISVGRTWIEVAYEARSYHFVLAPHATVIYRLLPAGLRQAKKGERVDVRYYQSGRKYFATRVELLVIHIHHPRSHTEYGTVGSILSVKFVLNTIKGDGLTVLYSGHVFFQELVSVRGWVVSSGFHAEKVHHLKDLPVHTTEIKGIISSVGSGVVTVHVGGSTVIVQVEQSSKVSKSNLPTPPGALRAGEYVSVRFWWQGHSRVARSIHIYAHIPIPTATGAVKGTLVSIAAGVIGIKAGNRTLFVHVPGYAHIRDGHLATFRSLKVGQTVSVRYSGAKTLLATSIHIYAGSATQHTFTGTVLGWFHGRLRVLDRKSVRLLAISKLTTIISLGKVERLGMLMVGDKVKVSTGQSGILVNASRIDVLPQTSTTSGRLSAAFRGPITRVGTRTAVLLVAAGVRETISLRGATKVIVRSKRVPASWLYSGPTADVAVQPTSNLPVAVEIVFHPRGKSLTGDVVSVHGRRMSVLDRSSHLTYVALNIATITDDGRPAGVRSLQKGLHVRIEGFALPGKEEAAFTVAVSHPTATVSGIVERVTGREVDITRTSGQKVELRFPSNTRIFDSEDNQWFEPSKVLLRTHLRATGTQEAGWLGVKTASVTFRSTLLHGTVVNLAPGRAFTYALATSGAVTVHVSETTKITDGRQILRFSDLEINDSASVREHPDADGGVLASSIDVHRKLVTHTGLISDLTRQSFTEVLRDGTAMQVEIGVFTIVKENGAQVPLDNLTDGQKVKMEGHLRPDGIVDGTEITIEAVSG